MVSEGNTGAFRVPWPSSGEWATWVIDGAAKTVTDGAKNPVVAMAEWEGKRLSAYGSVGSQLDMQYWDGVNDTTVWVDHIATVKAAHPKPE